ncbi:MAG: TIGR02584 family CRISPR-associated protein [Blastocatellales bacterium]|nr:TIGR02584 family CRISPR-associated protein [Blastocatellales bacterium]
MRDSCEMRQMLLCVAGMTPQIVTETLYVLIQERGQRIDEIRVITTKGGKDRIVRDLLDPISGRFPAFCRDYGIDSEAIIFNERTVTAIQTLDGLDLADIRSVADNDRAANRICEIVSELTKDPLLRIHASVAGGRKTMGIYLAAAMQLFGRSQDTLSHVLVNEDFEGLLHPAHAAPARPTGSIRQSDPTTIDSRSEGPPGRNSVHPFARLALGLDRRRPGALQRLCRPGTGGTRRSRRRPSGSPRSHAEDGNNCQSQCAANRA